MFDLSGKNALVTGGAGAIGSGIAGALHDCGATVIISGTREEALRDRAATLGDADRYLVADLADREVVAGVIATAERRFGAIDILVNNAGITRDGLAIRLRDADWDRVLRINLSAAFELSRGAVRGMIRRRFGRIIFVASIVGVTGNPGQANYVASKAGLIGLAKSLAAETASRGITVNSIAPGFIDTPMTQQLTLSQREAMCARIPQNRFGSPADIGAAAVYLASDEAGFVTGETLHINGGMAMI